MRCGDLSQGVELLKDHIVYLHIKDAVYSDHHVVPAGRRRKVKRYWGAFIKGFEGSLNRAAPVELCRVCGAENRKVEASAEDSGPKFAIAAYALKKLIRKSRMRLQDNRELHISIDTQVLGFCRSLQMY